MFLIALGLLTFDGVGIPSWLDSSPSICENFIRFMDGALSNSLTAMHDECYDLSVVHLARFTNGFASCMMNAMYDLSDVHLARSD